MSEIYFSTDIETNGPIPGPNSMWSFGSVALTKDGKVLGTFSANLEDLPGAKGDPDTLAWWNKPENAAALKACREKLQKPEVAMKEYVKWVKSMSSKPVFVAYPAGFDFLFMYWYMRMFAGESPFSFSALDIKSYASAVLGCDYRDATKKNFMKSWFPSAKHTHIALDDALEQGLTFINMRKHNLSYK